jgi:peptidoglycan/LPS O-acetylase OafA/YrhL
VSRRLHYIDWLRILAVLLLFPFHTSRVFNAGEAFYVKSSYLSMAVNYTNGFIDRWQMPLLFLLAGCSAHFSLAKRSTATFARERRTRLGVPLLFGILVIMPPQTYIGARFNSGYTGSFWRYITSFDFLRWNIQADGDYYGGFGVGHLWFVLFLLVLSMAALPIFTWGRSEGGSALIGAWARHLARPTWWFLPPAILWLAEAMPDLFGKNAVYYFVLFVLGYIVFADEGFAESAERHRAIALTVGTVLCTAFVATWQWRIALPDPSVQLTVANYLGMLGVWTILIGMLGVGRHRLDRPSRSLSYLAEASYPIYILHQTAIIVVASFVVKTSLGGVAQWVIIMVASTVTSFAIYEVVRRFGPMRYLFGMRPATHRKSSWAASAPKGQPG